MPRKMTGTGQTVEIDEDQRGRKDWVHWETEEAAGSMRQDVLERETRSSQVFTVPDVSRIVKKRKPRRKFLRGRTTVCTVKGE